MSAERHALLAALDYGRKQEQENLQLLEALRKKTVENHQLRDALTRVQATADRAVQAGEMNENFCNATAEGQGPPQGHFATRHDPASGF